MSIKNNLVSIMSVVQNYRLYRSYSNQFKYYLKQLSIKNVPVSGESEYLKKWSVFTPHVEPYSYRLFSHFMGTDAHIIPEDIGHTYIENVLIHFDTEITIRTKICMMRGLFQACFL